MGDLKIEGLIIYVQRFIDKSTFKVIVNKKSEPFVNQNIKFNKIFTKYSYLFDIFMYI